METSQKDPIMVMGLHRSGTNYVQQCLELNYNVQQIGNGKREYDRMWKHHTLTKDLAQILDSEYKATFFVVRHPIKWLNGVVKFCANLWKTYPVTSSAVNDKEDWLTVPYKDLLETRGIKLDIEKLIYVWNNFHEYWLFQNYFKNFHFVYYHDMLDLEFRSLELEKISKKYNFKELEKTSFLTPNVVEHSSPWSAFKTKQELDLDYTPNLNDYQLGFAYESFDERVIGEIQARRKR